MNLWSFLFLVLGAITLTGLAALVYCAMRAPDGFEDASGFRLGAEPAQPLARSRGHDSAKISERVRMGGAA